MDAADLELGLAWTVLVGLLAAIAVIDLRTLRIPNALNAGLLATGLAASGLPGAPGPVAALAGALLGGAGMLAVAVGFGRARGVEGLGMGDVKFAAGAGAWTGWQGFGPVMFVASAAALAVAALRFASTGSRQDPKRPIAFGPYLCAALLIVRGVQQVWPERL